MLARSPSAASSDAAYADFRQLLETTAGIDLAADKTYLIESRLAPILREHKLADVAQLTEQLKRGSHALQQQVVDAMTTNETQWFRDNHPFALLQEEVFPGLAERPRGRLRVWSAACSSGQEPYSVAMVFDEYRRAHAGSFGAGIEIVGTDISHKVLATAQAARFDEYAINRGLSPQRKSAYFAPCDGQWCAKPVLRQAVGFKHLNLLSGYAGLGRFQVIFCRNVLIYFSQQRKTDILQRMVNQLDPGGYLFLGSSETPPPGVSGVEMVRAPAGIVYRRPG